MSIWACCPPPWLSLATRLRRLSADFRPVCHPVLLLTHHLPDHWPDHFLGCIEIPPSSPRLYDSRHRSTFATVYPGCHPDRRPSSQAGGVAGWKFTTDQRRRVFRPLTQPYRASANGQTQRVATMPGLPHPMPHRLPHTIAPKPLGASSNRASGKPSLGRLSEAWIYRAVSIRDRIANT